MTQKEELTKRTKEKIIELFGPQSALAQAMESEDFFDKLGDLISWLFGEIMLTQMERELPRPRSDIWKRSHPPAAPHVQPAKWVRPIWGETAGDGHIRAPSSAGDPFYSKLYSALSRCLGDDAPRHRSFGGDTGVDADFKEKPPF